MMNSNPTLTFRQFFTYGMIGLFLIGLLACNPSNSAVENVPPAGCPENLGKIVSSYDTADQEGVNYGLYLVDPDGGNRKQITGPEEKHAMEPSWSPDRCRIAYISFTKEGNDDIYVITADGKSVRRLTNDPAFDVTPKWSPDGKQISFSSKRDGFWNLYIMDADGSNQRQLTKFKGDTVCWQSWSPKGDEIAFTYDALDDEFAHQIWVIRVDGSGLRQVAPDSKGNSDWEPIWSADGEKIFFISNRITGPDISGIDIWEIKPDGSGLRRISIMNVEYDYTHSLRISPDGKQFAFYGIGPEIKEYNQEIYVINADGSGLKAITHTKGREEWLDW
jgi:Tol biopolymer transport system component